MNTKVLTIRISGIVLEATYLIHYGIKSTDWREPSDPDELELFEIIHEGENIKDLLSDSIINQIESEIWHQ